MNKSWNREVFVGDTPYSLPASEVKKRGWRWRDVRCCLMMQVDVWNKWPLTGWTETWRLSLCVNMQHVLLYDCTHTHSVCVSLCCQLLCTVSVNAKGKTSREARGNDLFHSRLLQFHSAFFWYFTFTLLFFLLFSSSFSVSYLCFFYHLSLNWLKTPAGATVLPHQSGGIFFSFYKACGKLQLSAREHCGNWRLFDLTVAPSTSLLVQPCCEMKRYIYWLKHPKNKSWVL